MKFGNYSQQVEKGYCWKHPWYGNCGYLRLVLQELKMADAIFCTMTSRYFKDSSLVCYGHLRLGLIWAAYE